MKFDRDRMNGVPPKQAARATMAIADRVQFIPEEIRAVAAAVFFLFLAERVNVSAQDLFTATKNLLAVHKDEPEIAAVREYINRDLL